MTEQELYALIADHQADRVEFTVSTTDTEKFAEAVCAFATDLPNHGKPGHLIVGVRDNGQFGGIQVNDELLRNLEALRDDGNIQPLPAIIVEKLVAKDREVAVVTVQPTRFHGTAVLDTTRVGRDASRISEEVIAHLSGLVGATVTVTIEVDAEIPGGAPDHVVRTVTENS